MSLENISEDAVELRPAVLSLGRREVVVHSNYSRIGEHLRQVTPTELQCSVFCGGKTCKYDSSDCWGEEDMAIPGLYSHWVTETILATARPNKETIQKRDLVAQFLKHDIRTVINLQLAGEHASCGGPLTEAGFSYDPSVFMENGRLGRTGVLIACYLVYALRVRANDAIRYVRLKRPGAVQTTSQIMVVQEFEQFILPQLYVFSNREFIKDKRNPEFTLQQYLHRQRNILHGYEARTLRNIPKLIYVVCERLLKLCGCEGTTAPQHLLTPLEISYTLGTPSFTSFFLSAQYDHETRVSYSAPQSLGSPSLSASITSHKDHPERNIDSLLDDGITDQPLSDNLCYQELASQSDLRRQAEDGHEVVLTKDVYEALVVDHSLMDVEFKKHLKAYRVDLNVKQSAWDKLNAETSLPLLTGLLYTWLEHLKSPVLGVDALSYIVLAASRPEVCLRKLDKEARYTLEYLVRFVSRLQPFTRQQQEAVIRRIIAAVTQQAVPVRGVLLPSVTDLPGKSARSEGERKKSEKRRGFNKLREGTLRKLLEFVMGLFDLVYLEPRSSSAVSVSSNTTTFTNRVTPPGQVVTPPPDENGTPVDTS
ncbi:protein tyrosine phosphatase domain-containing protein 1-like isoform X3 [Scylla paramamosain]|uniref:protein tyrosine phosphatase domain-containing protein 1-like isoform X3 n=1 Tax=Scylla paramamosain TaxID=85552 RepID=UPI00308339A3